MFNQNNASIRQNIDLKTAKQTTASPVKLVMVGEFLLAVQCSHQEQPEIVETTVEIDLTEFQLTQEETEKLKKILHKMNFALTDAFSKVCLAASVMTDVRADL